ncbi:MAG: SDR family NAD(P)-dependent oxidoreductase [Bacteroidia bacterium]
MKQDKKNVLITGSAKGIGFETARQLGKAGLHIYLTGRNKNDGDDALITLRKEQISCEFILMDVSELSSIKQAFENFEKNNIQLDALINNAAILIDKQDQFLVTNEEHVRQTLNTNALGPLFVTQTFLSVLKSGSRIINVSSGGGSMTDAVGGWAPVYCISKTTLNAITRQLAYALAAKKISVNAVCPGWVRTKMGGVSAPLSIEKGVETIVWLATEAAPSLTGKFFRNKKEIPW